MNNEDFVSEADTSQYVHDIRPVGIKCTNSGCVYNDNAYFSEKNWDKNPYGGRCLNCIDDMNNERFYCE